MIILPFVFPKPIPMKPVSEVTHEATVQSVEPDSVTVILSPVVSCAGCQAEKSCGMSGTSAKIVRVQGSYKLQPGDRVNVSMRGSQGYMALFLGYLFPLVLVVVTLVTLISLNTGELFSGLTSFAILIPYYIMLWIFRNYIGKKFSFTIKPAI